MNSKFLQILDKKVHTICLNKFNKIMLKQTLNIFI